MKSPITGKEMVLCSEYREMEYKKENIRFIFQYYKCVDTGEQFTTTELDELNLKQLKDVALTKNLQ